jgi:hypothetical protein
MYLTVYIVVEPSCLILAVEFAVEKLQTYKLPETVKFRQN